MVFKCTIDPPETQMIADSILIPDLPAFLLNVIGGESTANYINQ